MESRIDHEKIQEKWQKIHEEQKDFIVKLDSRKSFSILNPPPNVTGKLHMGHFLNLTINDIIARRKRQENYNVCYKCGFDHAGLATQIKVEQYLKQQGLTKEMLGREKFLEECDKWKEKYSENILNQFKKIGLSCDFSNTTFTLDKNYSSKVIDTFVKLYNDDYIYKGDYMTNWCIQLQTAISDEECDSKEEEITVYYLRYKLVSKENDIYLTIATTRPETLFGDVAIAYNGNDDRYKKYKGMSVIVPIINKEIPIIEDDRIKIEFGTGLCKITPAHDKDDFITGQNNNLPIVQIFDKFGHICNTNTKYDGMYKDKARKELIKDLEENKILEKTEKKKSTIIRCSRSNTIIEPMVTKQWFIKMKKLANMASNLLETKQVTFYPERINTTFNAWIENIKDWCISRQIIYSHQIPVWYCENGHELCFEKKPEICHCGSKNLTQETDCLDTWASSWIWQFGTFTEEEEKYFYPLDIIVSGQDILFFWIMRMMMSSAYLHDKPPFKKVLFHGIVRDESNKKMSKSAGNGIDPLILIKDIGLDPMRFSIIMTSPKDGDLKLSIKNFDIGKKFCTKLWNVARYLQSNQITDTQEDVIFDELQEEDIHVYNIIEEDKKNIAIYYENLDLQKITTCLFNFMWGVFANGYLEFCKDKLNKQRKILLAKIFGDLLQLLYPIIPHVTEEIWSIMEYKNKISLF